jgi:hypothetical protein
MLLATSEGSASVTTVRPVVLYGASGSTGRLVAEYLREYGLPFVAAGRSKDRIQQAMEKVPGIETADYEIVEVEHTVEALTELFEGRQVVCNVVGPFLRYAKPVVEAALAAGCHYVDTAGEQTHHLWLLDGAGPRFARAGRVVSSAMSVQYAIADIEARICLETPGIDSLELFSYANAVPTVGSTRTIFDVIRSECFYLQDRELRRWPGVVTQQLVLPGSGRVVTGTNWGGTAMPVFFRDDGRVRNCRMYVAMQNQEIWKSMADLERVFKVSLQWLPEEILYPLLDQMSTSLTAASPPRENRHEQRSLDWCVGRGNLATSRVVMQCAAGYQITGLIQAYAAMRLLGSDYSGTGFRSPAQLLGHRELLGALEAYGFARITEETPE